MPLTINIPAGTTFKLPMWFKDASGAFVDLTGCRGRMQFRRQFTSPTPALNLTTENGGITFNGPEDDHRIDVLISESQTREMSTNPPRDKYVYDGEIEFPNGEVLRLIEGTAFVTAEVTRD